jgi:hypothetical protein
MTLYKIECRTGCTCCANDNHYRGFYLSREEALARITRFSNGLDNPVGSQYARYGSYGIEKVDCEQLPDGRIIIDNERVFQPESIVHINIEDGSILQGEEVIIHIGF